MIRRIIYVFWEGYINVFKTF